jgi:hypothetical protein
MGIIGWTLFVAHIPKGQEMLCPVVPG